MLLFLLCCQAVSAPFDVPSDDDPKNRDTELAEVAEDVKDLVVTQQQQFSQLEAMAHYLEDQKAVTEGRAPKGWVQPAYEEYAKPGAPVSFLPPPPPKK